jgi:isoamylase/glycogen operon protein
MTHTPSSPFPLGLSFKGKYTRFCVFSAHAKKVELGLFPVNSNIPQQIIPLIRTGDFWHTEIKDLKTGTRYAYRCHGDLDEVNRNLYHGTNWLLDPYAKFPCTPSTWKTAPLKNIKAFVKQPEPFDWEKIQSPRLAKENLIIYEMHVRGFTAHSSSNTSSNGTYAAMIEKIPYLKKLGINAVELLPIYEFDECNCKNKNPETDELLVNYWGYNPLSFFAPKRNYSANEDPVTEFKELVKQLHKNNIEVILDVVYNHTGEGSRLDPSLSWRGIDNRVYYLEGDFTGCGNTINSNHPQVQTMILDSLRYWVEEMHVDGFRFDLASTLTRDATGIPVGRSAILIAIANDPILKKVKLIAEPWDAAGLYQVGYFHTIGPWSEWNGKYRDTVRKFLKGTDREAGHFAAAIMGSETLYQTASQLASINFIVAHDGYNLNDLVTFQTKYNLANGEQNRDGNDQNDNWNCGEEGSSANPKIIELRERQIRNHWLALLISQGIPMILMGDEYGHTRFGNNNPYPQDNELNWFLWDKLSKDPEIFNFVSHLIAFRKAHPEFRQTKFLSDEQIKWHGTIPYQPNFDSRFIAFSTTETPRIYCAFNANHEEIDIELPSANFRLLVNTADAWDKHHFQSKGPLLKTKTHLTSHAAILAIEQ